MQERVVAIECYKTRNESYVQKRVMQVAGTTESYLTDTKDGDVRYNVCATIVGDLKNIEDSVEKIKEIAYKRQGKIIPLVKSVKVF